MCPTVLMPIPGGSASYHFNKEGANFIDMWRMSIGWKESSSNIILDLKDSDMVVIPERMEVGRLV